MLYSVKKARIERTCNMQEHSNQFKISFAKELFVEDFYEMRVFLQETRYVPIPGGAECMLCTITIARNSPILQELGEDSRKVILVGKAFMGLPHVKKLILLRAERLRQVQSLTSDLARPEGVVSTTLDREMACRQALAWEFKPKLIERTLRGRDGVVVRSATRVAQGIYANSDDHYKPKEHPFGQGGRKYRCYIEEAAEESMEEPEGCNGVLSQDMPEGGQFPFLDKLFPKQATDKENDTLLDSKA